MTDDLVEVLLAEREIRRLLDTYQIAWDSMTVDNIRSAEFFAPHGRLVEHGVFGEKGEANGVEEIVEWHTLRHRMLDERPKGLHTRMNYVIDVAAGCRRATVTGTFIYVRRDEEGFFVAAAGRYDDIVERDGDGRWWIVEHKVTLFPEAPDAERP
jgi:hypothetical protein